MNRFLIALTFVAVAVPATIAWGHGFTLTLVNGNLVATSGDPAVSSPAKATDSLIFLSKLAATANGFEADHGAAGGGATFIVNRHFSFDMYGPLWYSDGGTAVPAGKGIVMTLLDQRPAPFLNQTATLTGDHSGKVSGYPIQGQSNHEFIWKLSIDTSVPGHVTSIPDGVYGLAYYVSGGENGGADFGPTPLLLTAQATPNFYPDPAEPLLMNPNVNLAGLAMYEAALASVPEPSSVALLALGATGLSLAWWRRSRRVSTLRRAAGFVAERGSMASRSSLASASG